MIVFATVSSPNAKRKHAFPYSFKSYAMASLKTSDNNFENILFANVNFELFDRALRTRKQPDSGDNVIFVIFYLWSFCELKAVVHEKAVD